MDQAKVQALFRQFAFPLAGYAAISAQRRDGAEFMARTLWTALIAGPEMEEETWKILTTTGKLEADSLLAIQEMYYKKMKPVVSDEELVDLRQRYQLKRKEQA
jgi:hypothetical protein